jgi:hypothetical protein
LRLRMDAQRPSPRQSGKADNSPLHQTTRQPAC